MADMGCSCRRDTSGSEATPSEGPNPLPWDLQLALDQASKAIHEVRELALECKQPDIARKYARLLREVAA